jgi:hypothetical protein
MGVPVSFAPLVAPDDDGDDDEGDELELLLDPQAVTATAIATATNTTIARRSNLRPECSRGYVLVISPAPSR